MVKTYIEDFLIVDISIDKDELLKLYDGRARFIHATARDGRSVRFPANIMHKFILHDGIHGSFKVVFDSHHKFKEVVRV